MTKLEKGMYIRFNKLTNYYENKLMNIYKIKNITEIICSSQECLCIIFEESNEDIIFTKNFLKKYIVNASFNLIDLIEVGDYVNGNKVTKLGFDKLLLHCKTIECHQEDLSRGYKGVTFVYTNNDIKDVITKEQFEACKYVIERDE